MVKYSAAPQADANPLAPHQYQHDFVPGASYIVIQPVKGHSTTFRVKPGFTITEAVAAVRSRKMKPLYVIRTRPRALRLERV